MLRQGKAILGMSRSKSFSSGTPRAENKTKSERASSTAVQPMGRTVGRSGRAAVGTTPKKAHGTPRTPSRQRRVKTPRVTQRSQKTAGWSSDHLAATARQNTPGREHGSSEISSSEKVLSSRSQKSASGTPHRNLNNSIEGDNVSQPPTPGMGGYLSALSLHQHHEHGTAEIAAAQQGNPYGEPWSEERDRPYAIRQERNEDSVENDAASVTSGASIMSAASTGLGIYFAIDS